jgi:hypothetical protein
LPRPAVSMVLTLWTCQLSSLCERLLGRSIRPEVNETAPEGNFPGAAAGTCLFALTRQPLRRLGQPKAAVPDSCIQAASAAGERSCIHGKPMAETGQSDFPGHSAGDGLAPAAACRAAADAGGGRGEGEGQEYSGEFGVNGESPGKDGLNTNERSSLVFSELRRVTCGVAVHKAVDNCRDVRITGGILWTRCGQEKNLK